MARALPPFPPEHAGTLADRVAAWLRAAIVGHGFPSGAKLSERGLAALLGVSPMPVREALRRLEEEGMVETRPRSGRRVADLSPARLREIGLARAAVEGIAALLAAERASAEDRKALRQALAEVRAATRSGDADRVKAANEDLHAAIHRAARSPDLARLLAGFAAYDHMTRRAVLDTAEERARALREHAAIVEAILAEDGQAAEAAMRAHALRSLAVALACLETAQSGPPARTTDRRKRA
ncbi:MAG: GntR family transcriptional regulator [Acetobacteraceae bacterium]|nr:GntR family transcriptional regulator [Acetobacteraceae bacterium]MCX7683718.1 GntR family transcriptional regulator [Acetobacteraceae bacterium]MDW8398610.1 GntR family transcriptional regulator [Acetobacteraceae bacterium]